ncbi:hypothetical protein C6A86_011560 [Mycobacterium sp. ITM-2016-00316]|uniref:hypothetical protein n=1 Tax=Mycobacterium sp. ITM-2016-00316 TaxID=2099695 RepID=UPI000CF8CBF5|nr:hypothetical protein [Mycobacterium sp. ITM-2016-00316]WNG84222.1 hypothetical protein C6A86_011560 [Mycobacterium sp. ITM-2016-00316]
MLAAIALIPSAPVLVPELAGAAAAEVADLRAVVLTAAAGLPGRWIVIGAGGADQVIPASAAGTFAGYGADIRVSLGPEADGPVTELPLAALIAGWVRAQVNAGGLAEVRVHADVGEAAVHRGVTLRSELDESPDPIGVLVVADGANTLSESAPGGFEPDSVSAQAALDDALAAGDADAVIGCAEGAVGQSAYELLAGLAGRRPVRARELYRGAPFGVGYFVGTWLP